MKERLTTARRLLRHMAQHFPRDRWSARQRKLIARLVAFNSNVEHDPLSGFHRYRRDTPSWVVRISSPVRVLGERRRVV